MTKLTMAALAARINSMQSQLDALSYINQTLRAGIAVKKDISLSADRAFVKRELSPQRQAEHAAWVAQSTAARAMAMKSGRAVRVG